MCVFSHAFGVFLSPLTQLLWCLYPNYSTMSWWTRWPALRPRSLKWRRRWRTCSGILRNSALESKSSINIWQRPWSKYVCVKVFVDSSCICASWFSGCVLFICPGGVSSCCFFSCIHELTVIRRWASVHVMPAALTDGDLVVSYLHQLVQKISIVWVTSWDVCRCTSTMLFSCLCVYFFIFVMCLLSAAEVWLQQHWKLRWTTWRPDHTKHSEGNHGKHPFPIDFVLHM